MTNKHKQDLRTGISGAKIRSVQLAPAEQGAIPQDSAAFAKEAANSYAIHRGAQNIMPPHWLDLTEAQRQAFTAVYWWGRLDQHMEERP